MANYRKRRKTPRVWPVIREIESKTKLVFELDTGSKLTPRIRKRFDTKDEAEAIAERIRAERKRHGTAAFELTPPQRQDAVGALDILRAFDVSLMDTARFYMTHANPPGGDKTIREVWEEVVDFKERIQKKRPRYISDLNYRLNSFLYYFGDRDVKEISTKEIQTWLYSDETISEVTRSNIYAMLSVLFGYAQGKRDRKMVTAAPYRIDNPLLGVPRPTIEESIPKILNLRQVKRLLDSAHKLHNQYGLLPYVILGLYCGIRATELNQLDWSYVSLTKGIVTIHGKIAKKRRIRNIPIPENAKIWIAPYLQKSGLIAPINCTNRFQRFVKEAGFKKWPNNAMRHSFGSYHFAMTSNAHETSARLGHRGDDVLFAHYRALCDKSDAEEYFSIHPPWQEKIKVLGQSDLQEEAL